MESALSRTGPALSQTVQNRRVPGLFVRVVQFDGGSDIPTEDAYLDAARDNGETTKEVTE
jgi:hypothetical protein